LYRQAISNSLRDEAGVAVVGLAKDGVEALQKIQELDPDLLTLDVQMPGMDGIGVLREMNKRGLRPKAIMVSSLTSEGAQITTDALLEGAFDFILKPSGGDAAGNHQQLRDALTEKINAFRQSDGRGKRRTRSATPADTTPPADGVACRAVLVGTSTGGPAALKTVLPRLSGDLAVPVLVVQHMPAQYTKSLANRLNELCPLEVSEASSGAEVRPGCVLIAPGGRHMKLTKRDGRVLVRISDDPQEHGCRPSVDYLFRSAVEVFDGNALGVIMTGMGRDGAAGCEALKRRGGYVIAQHDDGCLVYGMPKAVIEAGMADRVLTLENIGTAIGRFVERSHRRERSVQTGN
jgi:two-component system chemotaxis response regulator CheB